MSKDSRTVQVLGVRIDALTIDEAIDAIASRVHQPEAVYVAKPYVEFMTEAHKNTRIRNLLNNSWLCLPDGISLNWAAYYQQLPRHNVWSLLKSLAKIVFDPNEIKSVLPDNFLGTKFTLPLMERAAKDGLKVFLIGRPEGSTIENTAAFLRESYPRLNIVGTFDGYHQEKPYVSRDGDIDEAALSNLLEHLEASQPDLILIGIGFPRQEFLSQVLTNILKRGVIIGEGGTFDYDVFGGKKKKAPDFMRNLNLEWLFRLFLEPKRIKRQLAIPHFIWKIHKIYK